MEFSTEKYRFPPSVILKIQYSVILPTCTEYLTEIKTQHRILNQNKMQPTSPGEKALTTSFNR